MKLNFFMVNDVFNLTGDIPAAWRSLISSTSLSDFNGKWEVLVTR